MVSRRTLLGTLLLGVLVAVVGIAFGGPLAGMGADRGTGTDDARATVTVESTDGTELGEIQAMVAATPSERYTGLGETDALGPDEGMVFVFASEGERTFVMRNMSFPLDIVFVGADGRITAIHEAPVANTSDLTPYRGRAKWVVEVRRGWTADHGVAVGDRVTVELPE